MHLCYSTPCCGAPQELGEPGAGGRRPVPHRDPCRESRRLTQRRKTGTAGCRLPAAPLAVAHAEKPKAAESLVGLTSWKKAKEIWILLFLLCFFFFFIPLPSACSPGLCGFPGAELNAAVQKHVAFTEQHAYTACANPEPCWVNPGSHHTTFMVLSFLSSSSNPFRGLGDGIGRKRQQSNRRKSPTISRCFCMCIHSCLSACLEGGWQHICAKIISRLFKKKVTKPSIVAGKTVCFSFKHCSVGNLNTVGAGKSERESKAIKHSAVRLLGCVLLPRRVKCK